MLTRDKNSSPMASALGRMLIEQQITVISTVDFYAQPGSINIRSVRPRVKMATDSTAFEKIEPKPIRRNLLAATAPASRPNLGLI